MSKNNGEQHELNILEMIGRVQFGRELAEILVNLENRLDEIDTALAYVLERLEQL